MRRLLFNSFSNGLSCTKGHGTLSLVAMLMSLIVHVATVQADWSQTLANVEFLVAPANATGPVTLSTVDFVFSGNDNLLQYSYDGSSWTPVTLTSVGGGEQWGSFVWNGVSNTIYLEITGNNTMTEGTLVFSGGAGLNPDVFNSLTVAWSTGTVLTVVTPDTNNKVMPVLEGNLSTPIVASAILFGAGLGLVGFRFRRR